MVKWPSARFVCTEARDQWSYSIIEARSQIEVGFKLMLGLETTYWVSSMAEVWAQGSTWSQCDVWWLLGLPAAMMSTRKSCYFNFQLIAGRGMCREEHRNRCTILQMCWPPTICSPSRKSWAHGCWQQILYRIKWLGIKSFCTSFNRSRAWIEAGSKSPGRKEIEARASIYLYKYGTWLQCH